MRWGTHGPLRVVAVSRLGGMASSQFASELLHSLVDETQFASNRSRFNAIAKEALDLLCDILWPLFPPAHCV